MIEAKQLQEFFAGGRWAVAGVSRDSGKYGSIVYRRLRDRGEEVYPVNPRISEIEGIPCYPTVADPPEVVDQIVIVTPARRTERIVEQAVEAGIRRIWMQPGAESVKAVEYCRSCGVNVVSGMCILRHMDSLEREAAEAARE